MRGSSQRGHTIKVEALKGCSKAQWVPSPVNQHRCASPYPAWSLAALEKDAHHGQQAAPWKSLGLRRSAWVSMDTCLNSDASLLNANRLRKGNRGVAQGEKILKRIMLLKHLNNTTLKRERLWSGVILWAVPIGRPEHFWHSLRHCASVPSMLRDEYFISGLTVPASTAFWMKTRGRLPGGMCHPTQRYHTTPALPYCMAAILTLQCVTP